MVLNLAEELLLLGLETDTGELMLTVTTSLPYGLAGALLLELFNADKIVMDNNNIKVINSSSTNDAVIDEALGLISKSSENKDCKYWVKKIISEMPDLIDKIMNNLVAKGILKKESKKILWIIPIDTFPMQDALPTVYTRLRVREIVLESQSPDKRDVALLSLIKATNLTDELFMKEERTQATNIINDLIGGEQIGQAIKDINLEITSIIASSVAGSVAAASVVGTY
ncbi:MAG TPA: GPP34 family phosphoprotein [Candidatus Kapabacteria bacterium]|nr:GPP34 family phosphoprotein [Candidatus Kapabacteria bacterium]